MRGVAAPDGSLVVDVSALQSPTTRGRGIGRYALGWCRALAAARPGLIGRYLLDPELPPLPGEAQDLVASGLVRYGDAPGATPPSARVFHTFSLLDWKVSLEQCWPPRDGHRPALWRSVTVFDCIPALDPIRELADAVDRRHYLSRFSLLAGADQAQVLSAGAGADLRRLTGLAPGRVVHVGAAADPRFVAPPSKAEARLDAIEATHELERPYVLYPSGSHPRKNNELLIRAFARLPGRIRRCTQLVISGSMPETTAHHFHVLSDQLGIRDCLVVTGDVPDDQLVTLYQGAELVCFPSLAEGYGLPVAEALACGTPAICSDRAPLDELLPADLRFDPTSVMSVSLAMQRALVREAGGAPVDTEPTPAGLVRGRPVSGVLGWGEVARRSAEAVERLSAMRPPPRGLARRRPRLAFVTPLPPAESGVASYSYRLAEALIATGRLEVDLFADGPTAGQRGPDGTRSERVGAFPAVEAMTGRYDHVLYALGNSHFHLGALGALRRRRGVVISHDVRLSNLYVHEHGDLPHSLRTLSTAVRQIYGPEMPAGLGDRTWFPPEQLRRYGLLLAREVIERSERYLVSSPAARELALSDVPGAYEERVDVLPFAIEPPPGWERRRSPPEGGGEPPVVAHFGIVDPSKKPGLLVAAVAELGRRLPDVRLAFVGPLAESLAAELRDGAGRLGVGEQLVLTGAVSPEEYRRWAYRASVAVQLRQVFNGEASAAVGESLAAGVATVVSDLGWMGSLPAESVVKVPVDVDAVALAGTIGALLEDGARRDALGRAGRREAERRSFAVTAEALVEIFEDTAARR